MVCFGRFRQALGPRRSEAARLLRGKHKPTFTPYIDTGDHVIVINAEKQSSPAKNWIRSIIIIIPVIPVALNPSLTAD